MRSKCWKQAEVYRVATTARAGEGNAPSWISEDIDSASGHPCGGLIVRKGYGFVGKPTIEGRQPPATHSCKRAHESPVRPSGCL